METTMTKATGKMTAEQLEEAICTLEADASKLDESDGRAGLLPTRGAPLRAEARRLRKIWADRKKEVR